jgi:chromatin segregation and condensation protein Rec8/ScpA/Scc1 (kleisin family)
LLDEVRRQKVAIEDIALGPMVARFLAYVHAATEQNLNLDIEWLHTAATLIYWKSRALLPPEATGEPAVDPIREGLIEQLLAHRKQAADELARRRAVEETRLSRTALDRASVPEPVEPGFVSVWDLLQQARDLARWVEQHRADRRHWRESLGVAPDDVTVGEMLDYLQDQLATAGGSLEGIALLEHQPTPSRRACLFLAMLELARDQQLELQQEEGFGPMLLIGLGGK